MTEESTSVKTMNPHPRIDMVKFNGINNFEIWRCEVMDALNASNLEDTLLLEKRRSKTTDEEWKKMNRSTCGLIRSCLTQDIKNLVLHETSARQLWETLEKKYLTKSVKSRLQLKSKLYGFQMQKGCSVNEHINRYTKLLTDLVNVDVKVDEKDKAVILLNSLLVEEYETFTLTFINDRQTLDYHEVSSALASYETRRKERQPSQSSSSTEALLVRSRGSSRKGSDKRGRSKSRSGYRDLRKNQCAFYREIGYWKVDCPKYKGKKKESKSEANLAKVINTQSNNSQAGGSDSDSSGFSFSVTTPITGHSGEKE